MINTIDQLLQNHISLSKDGKLYSEWHVRQAFELATATHLSRIGELKAALIKIADNPHVLSGFEAKEIARDALKEDKIEI